MFGLIFDCMILIARKSMENLQLFHHDSSIPSSQTRLDHIKWRSLCIVSNQRVSAYEIDVLLSSLELIGAFWLAIVGAKYHGPWLIWQNRACAHSDEWFFCVKLIIVYMRSISYRNVIRRWPNNSILANKSMSIDSKHGKQTDVSHYSESRSDRMCMCILISILDAV